MTTSFGGGIFVKIRVNSVTLFPLLLQRTGPLSVTLRLLGLFLFWFRVGRSTNTAKGLPLGVGLGTLHEVVADGLGAGRALERVLQVDAQVDGGEELAYLVRADPDVRRQLERHVEVELPGAGAGLQAPAPEAVGAQCREELVDQQLDLVDVVLKVDRRLGLAVVGELPQLLSGLAGHEDGEEGVVDLVGRHGWRAAIGRCGEHAWVLTSGRHQSVCRVQHH